MASASGLFLVMAFHIQGDLRPWRFAPIRAQAATVLELPCSTAAETGTEVGDKIEITIEGLATGKNGSTTPA
jgi:uncharacterized membrane protein (UPF0127 family)